MGTNPITAKTFSSAAIQCNVYNLQLHQRPGPLMPCLYGTKIGNSVGSGFLLLISNTLYHLPISNTLYHCQDIIEILLLYAVGNCKALVEAGPVIDTPVVRINWYKASPPKEMNMFIYFATPSCHSECKHSWWLYSASSLGEWMPALSLLHATCVIEGREISTVAKDALTRHYRYNLELNLLTMMTSLPFRFFQNFTF